MNFIDFISDFCCSAFDVDIYRVMDMQSEPWAVWMRSATSWLHPINSLGLTVLMDTWYLLIVRFETGNKILSFICDSLQCIIPILLRDVNVNPLLVVIDNYMNLKNRLILVFCKTSVHFNDANDSFYFRIEFRLTPSNSNSDFVFFKPISHTCFSRGRVQHPISERLFERRSGPRFCTCDIWCDIIFLHLVFYFWQDWPRVIERQAFLYNRYYVSTTYVSNLHSNLNGRFLRLYRLRLSLHEAFLGPSTIFFFHAFTLLLTYSILLQDHLVNWLMPRLHVPTYAVSTAPCISTSIFFLLPTIILTLNLIFTIDLDINLITT